MTRPTLRAPATAAASATVDALDVTIGAESSRGDPPASGPRSSPGPERPRAGRARSRIRALVLAAAVLVPVALFTWRALHAPVNFDGGMNLQVAENVAEGDGYVRFYDEVRLFPHEVQTNGPYMYIAVAAIELFGANQLTYQLSNLVFVAGFAGVVAFLLRRESLAIRVVGPTLVLLAVPMIATYGLGGLGEIPMSFFLFAALAALVEAVRSPARAPLWVLGASVAFGAALATKTFAIGAAGALAVGLLCVLLAAPSRRLRWQVVLSGAGVALLPAVREVHRLVTIGSVAGYRAWWSSQSGSISTQSGLDSGGDGGLSQTFLDHLHILSGLADFPAELLLPVLALPVAAAAGLLALRWRQQGLRRTVADPSMVLVLTVAAVAASYVLWWIFVVPDNKAWIRRIIPGLLALHLLYLLLVPRLVRAARDALHRRDDSAAARLPARRLRAGAALAGIALFVVGVVPYWATKVGANGSDLVQGEQPWLDANRDAAAFIQASDGQRYYGDEWWSAPVVSLMSHTGFFNLGDSDFCSLDPARDRLVWDHYSMTIRSQDPWTRGGRLVFDEVASFGSYVTIYAVGPAPGTCD